MKQKEQESNVKYEVAMQKDVITHLWLAFFYIMGINESLFCPKEKLYLSSSSSILFHSMPLLIQRKSQKNQQRNWFEIPQTMTSSHAKILTFFSTLTYNQLLANINLIPIMMVEISTEVHHKLNLIPFCAQILIVPCYALDGL